MAKATITIEDREDEDGEMGIRISFESTDEDDTESIANQMVHQFVTDITTIPGVEVRTISTGKEKDTLN